MQILDLYKYTGVMGDAPSSVITLTKIPGAKPTLMARLIADEGNVLTNDNGKNRFTGIDVYPEEIESYKEIPIKEGAGNGDQNDDNQDG